MHSLKETQTILHCTILIEVLGLQLPHSSIISKTQVVWSALVASLSHKVFSSLFLVID